NGDDLAGQVAERAFQVAHEIAHRRLVGHRRSARELQTDAELFTRANEGAKVLREAATAEAEARIEEVIADAVIGAERDTHVLHVAAGRVAEARYLVHEGDARGEERVGRVLDDFRALRAHADEAVALPVERRVEARKQLEGVIVVGADDDA